MARRKMSKAPRRSGGGGSTIIALMAPSAGRARAASKRAGAAIRRGGAAARRGFQKVGAASYAAISSDICNHVPVALSYPCV